MVCNITPSMAAVTGPSHVFETMFFDFIRSAGDGFVASAVIRHYGQQCKRLVVPVHKHFLKTFQTLYQDQPNIDVVDFERVLQDYRQVYELGTGIIHVPPLLGIESEHGRTHPIWDEQYYSFYGLPFSLRYTGFKVPASSPSAIQLYQQVVKQPRYIVTHRAFGTTRSGDLPPVANKTLLDLRPAGLADQLDDISEFQIIDLDQSLSDNMMDYIEILRNAEEIHVVPSSVFCLLDGITDQIKGRLFYHLNRGNAILRVNHQWNNYRWTVLMYDKFVSEFTLG